MSIFSILNYRQHHHINNCFEITLFSQHYYPENIYAELVDGNQSVSAKLFPVKPLLPQLPDDGHGEEEDQDNDDDEEDQHGEFDDGFMGDGDDDKHDQDKEGCNLLGLCCPSCS